MAGIVNVDVGGIFNGIFGLVDELFTSDEEREAAKLKVMQLHEQGKLAQIAVNMQEAKSGSWFVAGWRPAIGWVCALALAWNLVFLPIAIAGVTIAGFPATVSLLGPVAMEYLMPIALGMLGLRSFDKFKGTDTKSVGGVNRYGS